jgi:hypothetical protein
LKVKSRKSRVKNKTSGKAEDYAELAEKKRGTEAFDRKSPPFAERREGWGTLGYRWCQNGNQRDTLLGRGVQSDEGGEEN